MSRKCPECLEAGRAHLPGCSHGPNTAEREEFIRQHAVELVRQLEEKVRRQAKIINDNGVSFRSLKRDNERLRDIIVKETMRFNREIEDLKAEKEKLLGDYESQVVENNRLIAAGESLWRNYQNLLAAEKVSIFDTTGYGP